ncbi:Folic acid synthesis protein fol1, partial [Smittium culicis]
MDTIEVHEFEVRTMVGRDAWGRKKIQPLVISFKMQTSISKAAILDQVSESVHYGLLLKAITKFVEKQKLGELEIFAEHIAFTILTFDIKRIFGVFLTIKKPNSIHNSNSVDISIYRCFEDVHHLEKICLDELNNCGLTIPNLDNYNSIKSENASINSINTLEQSILDAGNLYKEDLFIIKGLKINVLLGANSFERFSTQVIIIDLTLHIDKKDKALQKKSQSGNFPMKTLNYHILVQNIVEYVEKGTGYLTLEALSISIARVCIVDFGFEKVSILVKKPCVLVFANCSAVKITRTRDQLFKELNLVLPCLQNAISPRMESHISYISIGTNLGDKIKNIHNSIKMINESDNIRVVDTGFLYQSKPMYLEDQPMFFNTAIKVETSLNPIALQKLLKRIEIELGRVFTEDKNGPRIIDLDIILYDTLVIDTAELTIPDPGMENRHFQLQPIIDMDPFAVHGKLNSSVCMLSRDLITIKGVVNDLVQVMPLSNSEKNGSKSVVLAHSHQKNTLVMGVTDVVGESFNYGGKFDSIDEAVKHSMNLFKEGADIIDIFSQSMSVSSKMFGPGEEAKIVIPIIEGIMSESKNYENKPIISVNTSDAKVAQKALDAGADVICNISGSNLNSDVFNVAAEYGCPLILMHKREDSKAISGPEENDDKYKNDVIPLLTSMNDIILSI